LGGFTIQEEWEASIKGWVACSFWGDGRW